MTLSFVFFYKIYIGDADYDEERANTIYFTEIFNPLKMAI